MRKQGTVRRWDDERGFGFIDSGDSRDVFVHARDFQRGISPTQGMAVSYEEIQVGGKGPRAMQVRPTGAATATTAGASRPSERRGDAPRGVSRPGNADNRSASGSFEARRPTSSDRRTSARAPAPATGTSLAMLLMLVWLALLAGGVWLQRLPFWLLGAALLLNLITFLIYGLDKSAAKAGRWRTSEKQLHLLSLLGGWPAAWFAQQTLRHKSSKQEFRTVYWLTLFVNLAVLGALVIMPGLASQIPFLAQVLR